MNYLFKKVPLDTADELANAWVLEYEIDDNSSEFIWEKLQEML